MKACRDVALLPISEMKTNGGDGDCFLRKRAAAAFCGLSTRTLMNAPVPRYKPCGKILFRKSELIQWLERSRECGNEQGIDSQLLRTRLKEKLAGVLSK